MTLWDRLKLYMMPLRLTEYDIVVPNSIFLSQGWLYDEKIPKLVVKVSAGTSEKICNFILNRKRISFSEILSMLTKSYPDVQAEIILKDLKVYLEELNRHGIIVYEYYKDSSLMEKIKFYFLIFIRGYRNRKDIESSKISVVLWSTLNFVLKTYLLLIILLSFSIILLFLACSESEYLIYVLYYMIFGISLFLSIAIHECIHLLTYRVFKKKQEGYLISRKCSISFFREEIFGRGRILVRLLAPLVTAIFGIILFLSTDYFAIKVFSSVFIFHIVNLLPFFGDGYAIINDLLQGEEV